MLAWDKHSKLIRTFVNCAPKSFITLGLVFIFEGAVKRTPLGLAQELLYKVENVQQGQTLQLSLPEWEGRRKKVLLFREREGIAVSCSTKIWSFLHFVPNLFSTFYLLSHDKQSLATNPAKKFGANFFV
jgi:hypothetical protein